MLHLLDVKITVKPSHYLSINLISVVKGNVEVVPLLRSYVFSLLIPNSFSMQPFTMATDTVCPLTPTLFGLIRETSPRGIINQPEARRSDWPLVTFGLTRSPLSHMSVDLPEESSASKSNSPKTSTDHQIQTPVRAAQLHILGPASHRNPAQSWLC